MKNYCYTVPTLKRWGTECLLGAQERVWGGVRLTRVSVQGQHPTGGNQGGGSWADKYHSLTPLFLQFPIDDSHWLNLIRKPEDKMPFTGISLFTVQRRAEKGGDCVYGNKQKLSRITHYFFFYQHSFYSFDQVKHVPAQSPENYNLNTIMLTPKISNMTHHQCSSNKMG